MRDQFTASRVTLTGAYTRSDRRRARAGASTVRRPRPCAGTAPRARDAARAVERRRTPLRGDDHARPTVPQFAGARTRAGLSPSSRYARAPILRSRATFTSSPTSAGAHRVRPRSVRRRTRCPRRTGWGTSAPRTPCSRGAARGREACRLHRGRALDDRHAAVKPRLARACAVPFHSASHPVMVRQPHVLRLRGMDALTSRAGCRGWEDHTPS